MFNPNQLKLDTTILQSKTVGNLVQILKHGLKSKDPVILTEMVRFIVKERKKSIVMYGTRSKGGHRKTTVDKKLKVIKRSEDDT
tara:strand:+ start:185 stop:436 length:252 start_codon:yes stop_codon:yes gene_type:complete